MTKKRNKLTVDRLFLSDSMPIRLEIKKSLVFNFKNF